MTCFTLMFYFCLKRVKINLVVVSVSFGTLFWRSCPDAVCVVVVELLLCSCVQQRVADSHRKMSPLLLLLLGLLTLLLCALRRRKRSVYCKYYYTVLQYQYSHYTEEYYTASQSTTLRVKVLHFVLTVSSDVFSVVSDVCGLKSL